MELHCEICLLKQWGTCKTAKFPNTATLSYLATLPNLHYLILVLEISTRGHEYEKGYRIKNVVTFLRRRFPGRQQCWCQIWHPKSGIQVLPGLKVGAYLVANATKIFSLLLKYVFYEHSAPKIIDLFITKVDICSQNCHLCYQNRLNGSQTRLPQNANFEPWLRIYCVESLVQIGTIF
jgi:hypothetical protein